MFYLSSILFSYSVLYGQELCTLKPDILRARIGVISVGSTVMQHLYKYGTNYSLEEFDCGINVDWNTNRAFTVNQQADLVYFETYFDSTHTSLKVQGYYRLVFKNPEYGYCWMKDLVWNTFDDTGKLLKKEFYSKGVIQKASAMPQPITKN